MSSPTLWRRILCILMGGHDMLRHTDRDAGRAGLRCVSCGYTTEGWPIGPGWKLT